MKDDTSLRREDMIIQSKCGIRQGYYDLSFTLLLHRPDALVESEEVFLFDESQRKSRADCSRKEVKNGNKIPSI